MATPSFTNYGATPVKAQPNSPIQASWSKNNPPTAGVLNNPALKPMNYSPSTPVKSVTGADGTKTEFHAPTKTATSPQPTQTSNQQSSSSGYVTSPSSSGYMQGSNAVQQEQQTTPQPQKQPDVNTTYPGLIQALANKSQQNPEYQQAVNQAELIAQQQRALADEYAQKTNNIAGTAGFLTQQTGLQGQLQNQYNIGQSALANQYQGAVGRIGQATTQQQAQQSALQQAAGLAAPQLAGFNQQAFNPQTGQFSGGQSMQDAVNSVVQKLQSGQMTYSDAVSALSGYGQGGINALQQSLPQGYNIAQSNTLAGQQGSIKPAQQLAKVALQNLKETVSNLGIAQGTNIPIINAIGNYVQGDVFRTEATRKYQQAIAEARSAYSQVLSAAGATPSASDARALAAIPDNATPNDINAAISSLEGIGQAKANIYGNPGQSGAQSTSSLFSW